MQSRLIAFQVDGLHIAGQVVFPSSNKPAAGVIICHGIPATRYDPTDRRYTILAEKFAEAGFVAMLFNFRGAGKSQGNFDILGWKNDLKGALDYLTSLEEVDRDRVGVLGSSGGGAVAACVAAEDKRVSCLALMACPADFDILLQPGHAAPFVDYLCKLGLIKDAAFPTSVPNWMDGFRQVRPVDCIGRISPRAVLIVHGEGDETVPVEHARKLYGAAGEPKEMVLIPGAQHRLRLEEEAVQSVLGWFRRRTPPPL